MVVFFTRSSGLAIRVISKKGTHIFFALVLDVDWRKNSFFLVSWPNPFVYISFIITPYLCTIFLQITTVEVIYF